MPTIQPELPVPLPLARSWTERDATACGGPLRFPSEREDFCANLRRRLGGDDAWQLEANLLIG